MSVCLFDRLFVQSSDCPFVRLSLRPAKSPLSPKGPSVAVEGAKKKLIAGGLNF